MTYYPSQFGSIPSYQPMPIQPTYVPPQQTNGVIKVNGPNSALQYSLPPNSQSPALFDNNGQVFYIVSTDGTGTKTIETFDFSPHVEEEPVMQGKYVSQDQFDELVKQVREIQNGIHGSVQPAADGTESSNGPATQRGAGGPIRIHI